LLQNFLQKGFAFAKFFCFAHVFENIFVFSKPSAKNDIFLGNIHQSGYTFSWLLDLYSAWKIFKKTFAKMKIFAKTFMKAKIFATFCKFFSRKAKKNPIPDPAPNPVPDPAPHPEPNPALHTKPNPAPHLDQVLVPDLKLDQLVHGFNLSKTRSGKGSGFILQIYCDSALCGIEQSFFRDILVTTPRYAAQRRVNTYSQISLRNRNQILKYFRTLTSDLRGIDC
jgi:hypothetical protein